VLKTKISLGALGALIFFCFACINIKVAINYAAGRGAGFSTLTLLIILAISIFLGAATSTGWNVVLCYLNQVPFGYQDPIFGNDISFYFFSLPFYQFVKNLALFGVVLTGMATFLFYFLLSGAIVKDEYGRIGIEFPKFGKATLSHLSLLGGIAFTLVALGYILERYSVLYSERGVVFGAGYTDVNVQLPLITFAAFVSAIIALIFFGCAKKPDIRPPLAGIAFLMVVIVFGGALAGLVQQYKVSPDEFNLEKPFLLHNIKATRKAYDLEDIKEVEFPANYNLSFDKLKKNNLTIKNIRLWDWRPLMRTYKQVQLIRTYYDFNDVDIDRYVIGGDRRQVMLSAREINSEYLPEKTWVNKHLVFTHGYGIAMSPVREISKEGLPILYVKDIPPKSQYFEIEEPGIYYGELTNDYVIVKTTTEELDYPKGEKNIYTTYKGKGGIELSLIRKAAMAARFGTLKILVSDSIKKDSRILFKRNIKERASEIAPFLKYDKDPYVVLSEGKIYWMMDAYTISDKYPYSEPEGDLNYIRNSVKVVISAYDGNVDFYVIEEEPVIKTYMNIFPGLFKKFSAMPEDLKKHVRYPEDLFSIQVSKYAVYHMKDPRVFYNKEDVWEIPSEVYEEDRIVMEPYYLITKLPDSEEEEFILLLPFTPKAKNNMIAWFAARGDHHRYGEKIVYVFPKEKLIYGPIQIEARIDQDPAISQLFTLWSQAGSKVVRGNLLPIPIEDSLLYVEPIYLRAEQEDSLPELKRVIVSFGDRLTMQETLERSLSVIFAEPLKIKEEKTIPELIKEAWEKYESAQQYLKEGNWKGYGEEQEALEKILSELKKRVEQA
jgi:hypothetical protein